MIKKLTLTAPLVGAAFMGAVATSDASAETKNGVHGWDQPETAEFVLEDVRTKFLYPSVQWRSRDVAVDCDLLVKDGQNLLITTGFVAQFNAETEETLAALTPQTLQLLQNWRGQLDYNTGRVRGTIQHMDSQHDLSDQFVINAAKTCKAEYPSRGYDINLLGSTGPKHPQW